MIFFLLLFVSILIYKNYKMENWVNKVELRGNVGFDPKLISLEDGGSFIRFSLATNETFKNRKGELHEETVWHSIIAWMAKTHLNLHQLKNACLQLSGRIKAKRVALPYKKCIWKDIPK
jgi:single-strand DNA-binding protein